MKGFRMTLQVLSFSLLILSTCTIAPPLVASQEAVETILPNNDQSGETTPTAAVAADEVKATTTGATSTEAVTTSSTSLPAASDGVSMPPVGITPSDQSEPESITKVLEGALSESRTEATTEATSETTSSPDTKDQVEDDQPETPTAATAVAPTGDDAEASPEGVGLLGKSISHAHSDPEAENSLGKQPEGETTNSRLSEADGGGGDEGDDISKRPINAGSGPTHLNLSEIDQVYLHGTKDEQETVENWRKLGKRMKKGISSVLGSMVPFALNMSQEAKISNNCSGAILKWVLSMNQLKAWALRMLDASGKPIAGLLEGSMTMFGNYRQCLKVRAPDDDEIEFAGEFREYFRGKYCVIQAKPWLPEKDRFYNLNTKLESLNSEDEENPWYDRTIFEELNEWFLAFNFVNIRYDLCIPSVCSREDIQKAINYLLGGIELKARVLRCETDGPSAIASDVESGSLQSAEAFLAKPDEQSQGFLSPMFNQLGWMLIPLLAIVVVLVATALSLTIKEDADGDMDDTQNSTSSSKRRSKLKHTIKSLSLKRSFGCHLNVDYNQLADDKPLALYGLRFFLVLWVILVESAVNIKFEYLRELLMLKDLIFWWPMQFIINSTMQYDSFILLTAFTMGYKNCLNDGFNNVKAITMYVVDKYIRLMPSIMVMVALVIVMPLAYRGPVWNDYVVKQSTVCRSTGWVNTVFMQNYLSYDQICLPQTWLLCVELQLLLIMAPIVYYLNRSYTSNFGSNEKNILLAAGSDMVKRQANARSCRRDDSSKAFHWLWTKPGVILASFIAFGLGSSFYNVYYKELPPSWFYTMADPDSKALYFGEHMTKIWTHLAVFAMGILAGVECRRATKNVYRSYRSSNLNFISHTNNGLSKQHRSHASSASSLPIMLSRNGSPSAETASSKTSASDWNNSSAGSSISINIHNNMSSAENHYDKSSFLGSEDIGYIQNENGGCGARSGFCSALIDFTCFILAITIMSAIIFSTHEWSLNDLPKPMVAGMFDAGSRFLWSMAMIWVLYMLSVPNQDRSFSCIAKLLGHPGMVFLGKLSFLIYIIHPFVHTLVLAIQEQPIYSSWLMLFHILIGNITITVILASLVSVFVEMPCRNLFRRCGASLLLTQSVPAGPKRPTETST